MSKIIPLKTKLKYSPYKLAKMGRKTVELISFPFYEDYNSEENNNIRIMVRKPNDPTTLEEVNLRRLRLLPGQED